MNCLVIIKKIHKLPLFKPLIVINENNKKILIPLFDNKNKISKSFII